MSSRYRARLAALTCIAGALLVTTALRAQQQPSIGTLLTTFLADSGVRTQGLPFTVAASLPIRWQTPAPVAADVAMQREGFTLERRGTATVSIGEKPAIPVSVALYGNRIGLQSVVVGVATAEHELTERSVLAALRGNGITLAPLKCDIEKEGASFGNLAYVLRAPGKTASGLWAMWQCPQDGCNLTLTILYRRSDMAKVECYSGG